MSVTHLPALLTFTNENGHDIALVYKADFAALRAPHHINRVLRASRTPERVRVDLVNEVLRMMDRYADPQDKRPYAVGSKGWYGKYLHIHLTLKGVEMIERNTFPAKDYLPKGSARHHHRFWLYDAELVRALKHHGFY